jgi:hypothetical protein
MIKPRTLEQMQFRATAYEVALYERASGRMLQRLTFSERKTKRVLLDIMARNRAAILAIEPDANDVEYDGNGWCTNKHRVAFSGRTERDCAMVEASAAA